MLRVRLAEPARFVRRYSLPGWKTAARSSGSAKTKEQRDVERRRRQLEKLPSPVALHDHQYPLEKTVLCDQHFQRPVYDNHLDTPELFNLVPPDDFFVFWNIKDCGRTAYPPVPEVDHRLLSPKDGADWQAHRAVMTDYLEKHHIVPGIFPTCLSDVQLNVTFGGKRDALTRENFWMTSHCGNFIELKELMQAPRIDIDGGESGALYTIFIASPDYPSRSQPNAGFFLHHVVCNVRAGADGTGDVVVPYVHPLPTEDAGCARVLCIAYKQPAALSAAESKLTFEQRSNYRMHSKDQKANERLRDLERQLPSVPSGVSFFHTTWDIQVQEWYQANGLLEPAYIPADLDRIVSLNALPKEKFQISSRTRPDGTSLDISEIEMQQYGETIHHRRSANHLLSARTLLSKDRKNYTVIQDIRD